jgi:hypothetical protein
MYAAAPYREIERGVDHVLTPRHRDSSECVIGQPWYNHPRAFTQPFNGARRDAEGLRRLGLRQTSKEAAVHNPRLSRVQHRETIERLVDCQENIGPVTDREVPGVFRLERLERDGPRAGTATSFRTMPPSVIDEDAPHHVRGDRVKLCAVRPMSARLIDESQDASWTSAMSTGCDRPFETELLMRDSGEASTRGG